jgi:putative phage-type endonuclease
MNDGVEQGTNEWLRQRVGKLTASRFADAIAKTKTGWGASRDRYMAELICERMTGEPYPQYTTVAMQRGTELEPQARAAYAFHRDVDVIEVGFIPHPTITMSGCSPDGLVDADGLVELKCPDSHVHISYCLGAQMPGEYIMQMMWQLACTGRQWCDWVSYDPRLPSHRQLLIRRITRSDDLIRIMEDQARAFLAEVEQKYLALQTMPDWQMDAVA